MNRKLMSFLFIVAVIFTIALITAPPRHGENHSLIDSLKKRAYDAERDRDRAIEQARQNDILANTWFNEAEKLRQSKTVLVTRYIHEAKRIDSLSDPQLDSLLLSVYPFK